MPTNNLSFEFLLTEYMTANSSKRFTLDKTVRKYFRLDAKAVDINDIKCNRYVSFNGLKINLEIYEGEFYNQFFFDYTGCIHKKTFLIFKNKKLIGIFEIHAQFCNDDRFDWMHFFVKTMNDEEIRLTIEHILANKVGSELRPIRDQMIQYITAKPTPSFVRC